MTEANRAPAIDPIPDQVSAEGGTVDLAVVATDPDLPANVLSFSATGLPMGLTIDPSSGLIAGTVSIDSSGVYSVTIVVTDSGTPSLLATKTFTWTVINTNRPPVLDSIGDLSGTEQTVISFTASATDPDSDGLVFTVSGAPAGAVIDPESGVFTWIPSESQGPGSFDIVVMVTDTGVPALADSEPVTIAVAEYNLPPSLASISDQISIPGDAIDLEISATDPDLPSGQLRYAATGLPPGLTIDPMSGVISGTIETAPGDGYRYAIEVTATDDGTPRLSAATTFAWTVTNPIVEPAPNLPPTISPISDQYTGEGNTVSLAVDATYSGLVTFTATGLPPGLIINPATGLISGAVDGNAIGSHNVTITVTDNGTPSLQAARSFTWTVTDLVAAVQKEDLVQALDNFETSVAVAPEEALIRRSLALMSGAAAATTESLRWPFVLLVALLVGFATVGRVGLYPLLWRGDRQTGTMTLFDPELSFGLIDPDEAGEPVHVHANAFPRRLRATLAVGMRVRYRVLASDNRSSAWGATLESHE